MTDPSESKNTKWVVKWITNSRGACLYFCGHLEAILVDKSKGQWGREEATVFVDKADAVAVAFIVGAGDGFIEIVPHCEVPKGVRWVNLS